MMRTTTKPTPNGPTPTMTPQEFKQIRRRLKLTQQALSDQLGVRLNSLWRWEAGRHPIPLWASKFLAVLVKQIR